MSWTEHEGEMLLLGPGDLVALAGGRTLQDVADWISGNFELDAWLPEQTEGGLIVAFGTQGTLIEFPLTVGDLWEQLDDLETEVIDLFESEEE